MRRWTGSVGFWNVSLNLLSSDDDNARLSRTLSSATDQVCQLICDTLFDSVLPDDTTFVWYSNSSDMNNINNQLQAANNAASNWIRQHRLRMESLFTFVSFGPDRGQRPTRYTIIYLH